MTRKINRESLMKRKLIAAILIFQINLLILIISNSGFLLPTSANNYDIIVEPGDSIQDAINNASEGQIIYIKKGEYVVAGERGIDVNKTVTILGESVNETIIDGNGAVTTILNILTNRVEIQNLTIRNSKTEWHEYGGIRMKDVANVKIQNCHIKNCASGVILTNSTHCEISRNLITNNIAYGIYFVTSSSYNTIFWDTIKNNTRPIFLGSNCKENTFYQNNFIQNQFQVDGLWIPANLWNNTYPAGGNYWSDYTHDDVNSGPYQNRTGSDGVGDESYELPLEAKDHYPIMGSIHYFHAYGWENIDYYTLVSSNITDAFPSNFHFDPKEAFINFTLTGNIEKGFCRVTIPKQLLWVEDGWVVTIDNEGTENTFMSDINYTYICFAYNYSNTKTVKIQGTHCIPEFSSPNILLYVVTTMFALVILKITKTNSLPPYRSKFQKP